MFLKRVITNDTLIVSKISLKRVLVEISAEDLRYEKKSKVIIQMLILLSNIQIQY